MDFIYTHTLTADKKIIIEQFSGFSHFRDLSVFNDINFILDITLIAKKDYNYIIYRFIVELTILLHKITLKSITSSRALFYGQKTSADNESESTKTVSHSLRKNVCWARYLYQHLNSIPMNTNCTVQTRVKRWYGMCKNYFHSTYFIYEFSTSFRQSRTIFSRDF